MSISRRLDLSYITKSLEGAGYVEIWFYYTGPIHPDYVGITPSLHVVYSANNISDIGPEGPGGSLNPLFTVDIVGNGIEILFIPPSPNLVLGGFDDYNYMEDYRNYFYPPDNPPRYVTFRVSPQFLSGAGALEGAPELVPEERNSYLITYTEVPYLDYTLMVGMTWSYSSLDIWWTKKIITEERVV